MTNLVAAEFLKLRSTRTFWVLTGLSVALVILTVVAQMASDAPSDKDGVRALLAGTGIGALFMLILGGGQLRRSTATGRSPGPSSSPPTAAGCWWRSRLLTG